MRNLQDGFPVAAQAGIPDTLGLLAHGRSAKGVCPQLNQLYSMCRDINERTLEHARPGKHSGAVWDEQKEELASGTVGPPVLGRPCRASTSPRKNTNSAQTNRPAAGPRRGRKLQTNKNKQMFLQFLIGQTNCYDSSTRHGAGSANIWATLHILSSGLRKRRHVWQLALGLTCGLRPSSPSGATSD